MLLFIIWECTWLAITQIISQMRINQYKSIPILSISLPLQVLTTMEKNEESNQPEPSVESSENEAPAANVVDPLGFLGPDPNKREQVQGFLDALPEEVSRRYLEGINNTIDVGELLCLAAWALSHHPGVKPDVTLHVEEVAGNGIALIARRTDYVRLVRERQVIMVVYDTLRQS
ncbi:hypothetical protein TRVA0_001S01882 [Trichomonascus vanleenenianus]|uniref:uncharacterized protein n=1 Tax=Trichomonascus vanleenenianus TaxID=2268995 RepID=UPI003ECB5BD8